MERVAAQESEFGSAGWISMCDVYLLFSALVVALCFAIGTVAERLGLEKRDGDRLIAVLESERNSLRAERDALQREVSHSVNAKEGVPALRLQVDTLTAELERLKPIEARAHEFELSLDTAARELEESRMEAKRLLEELQRANIQRAESEAARDAALKEISGLQGTLHAQQAELLKARDDLAALRSALSQAERRVNQLAQDEHTRQDREGQIRQELLGLKGSLDRVVFLFDRSGSMNEGGRWTDAKETMRIWLEHLPVKEAAVVTFSSSVQYYPEDGRLLTIDDAGRRQLVATLDNVKPGGATNTYEALKRAYGYGNVDAFILFTDGQPNPTGEGSFSRGSARDVYRLVEAQHATKPSIRIHTVGVGDYFSGSMRDFLLTVARLTDGSYLGR